MLKDELQKKEVTQKEFAQLTGIPQTQLNEIIKGKRGIYADTALLIGKALNMDAVIWTNLQMNYELDVAKQNDKNKIRIEAMDKWKMIESYIPFKFFKKQEILSGNPVADIPVIKDIYSISNLEQLASVFSQPNYARFRKSGKLTIDKINLVGWVKLVNYKAAQIKVAGFDVKRKQELAKKLNDIFRKNKKTIEKTREVLAEYGIKLVVQPHPEKCAIDGISFWSNGNPAIGVTIRHKRIDNFAFTVLHEIGHVFLHLVNNNTAEFIDLDKEHSAQEYINSKEEKEANEFAGNALIEKEVWENFMAENPFFEEVAIRSFALKNKIHPAVVQGRFLFETDCFKVRSSIDKTLN
jgi:HTH-type transcriptional regulator / antitoxin HigA